jgi:transporter family-2 protein
MSKEFFYLIALIAGSGVAVQAGMNSQLRLSFNHPVLTAFISFAVGTLALLAFVLIKARQEFPSLAVIKDIPWWHWCGGLMGVFYVTAVVIVAPRIGAAGTLGFVIAGQLLTAVLLDHFGWLGFQVNVITPMKILGVVLLIIGLILIRK